MFEWNQGELYMEKKRPDLSAQDLQTKKSVTYISDHEIDYSDIPELTDEQLKGLKRVGRPLEKVSKKSLKKSV